MALSAGRGRGGGYLRRCGPLWACRETVVGVLALIAAVRAAMGLLEASEVALGRIGLRSASRSRRDSPGIRLCWAFGRSLLLGWSWCWAGHGAGLVMVLVVVLVVVLGWSLNPAIALASLTAAGGSGGLPRGPAGRCAGLWRVECSCGPIGTSGGGLGRQRGRWAGIWAC